jgi:hypothetical protein
MVKLETGCWDAAFDACFWIEELQFNHKVAGIWDAVITLKLTPERHAAHDPIIRCKKLSEHPECKSPTFCSRLLRCGGRGHLGNFPF